MEKFENLKGKILKDIKVNEDNDRIIFITNEDEVYVLTHFQDCCESVIINDINGDLDDLIGFPITLAEEVKKQDENPGDVKTREFQESFIWTFYKLATVKGYVTIRWYGESNGYYSEDVDFIKKND